MTRRNRLLTGGIIAGLLGLLWVAPALVPLDSRKAEVAERVKAVTGLPLTINGKLSLSLLPRPHLSVRDVVLGSPDGTFAHIGRLEARLALMPLLSGETKITSLALRDAELYLHPLGDGRPLLLERLDATLTAEGPEGPFHAEGSGRLLDRPLSFEADLGALGPQPSPLHLTLGLDGHAALAKFDGSFSDAVGLSGKLAVQAESLRHMAEGLGWSKARLPDGGFALNSRVSADGKHLSVSDIAFDLAGAQGSGEITADFTAGPQWDVALVAPKLDLDAWTAKLPPAPAPSNSGNSSGNSASTATPVTGPIPGLSFNLPKSLAVNCDLTIGAVRLNGGELSHVRANLAVANGEVLVNQAGAELPGQGEANIFGFLMPEAGGIGFDGNIEASAEDLRGLLDWLKLDPAGMPQERLRHGRFQGKLQADAQALRLSDGLLKLDDSRFDLAADLRYGPRPALGLTLAVDKLNLDAYRLDSRPADPAKPTEPATTATKSESLADAGPKHAPWLDSLDANIKATAGELRVRSMTAREVALNAEWLNGVLTLHQGKVADLDGARVSVTGGITGLRGKAMGFQHLQWTLHADKPAKLFERLPVDNEHFAPATLTGSADGSMTDGLTLESRNEVAGGQFDISGKIEHPTDKPLLHLTAQASHASLPQVTRLFWPNYHPAPNLGNFAASTRIEGGLDTLRFEDLRLKLGPAAAAGQASLTQTGERPRLDLTLSAGEIPVDPFLPTERRSEQQPSLREQIRRGLLIPSKGTPTAFTKTAFSKDSEPPPPKAASRPKVQESGLAEHYSSDALPLMRLTKYDAAVKLEARALVWGQTRLETPVLTASLNDGLARLDSLKAGLWNGKLDASASLKFDGSLELKAKLEQAQMHDALLSTAGLGMAEGVMDGETTLSSKGQSPSEWMAKLAGDAKASVKDGTVKGFDLKAVDDKAKALDGNPMGLLSLLQAGLSGGSTHFSALSATAKIKNGIISSDDLTLTAEGGSAKGEAQVSLPGHAIDAHAAFSLDGLPDMPPLVMRLTGPLDNPRRFLDINGMQGWLAQKSGIGKSVGKAVGKLLDQAKDENGKIKAKNVVKGLLQKLH